MGRAHPGDPASEDENPLGHPGVTVSVGQCEGQYEREERES